jgi:hypothetical protein
MSAQSRSQGLQQLNDARAERGLPPLTNIPTVMEIVNQGLQQIGHPAIRIGEPGLDGVVQVHGKTTNIIRSHVVITRHRDNIVESAMTMVTGKNKKRPAKLPRTQRRWSVDCSTYS